ncbi:MAG: sigma-54-dependent Fis family transcriptional regulator [Gemmatimonadetes bacterium]|jgi:two-component system NtrC family response regulator|nr:sigma-54-dependent Fis family transcriptional regulator [Gemmatimonadota bacterium]MDE0962148.1 sigma-54 dependent transcriptional regulator [Candidatus Latescibacterota bacterium]MBT5329074.1 sigma-54-dependent Fis family transcriptional regulator [Gemmatimonadota bacterium]MBT5448108.1 sigma-54-dependent Fis family transcriptional regulator [Gemmatimonadota bacterium]MBT5801667.1 sigma-54-dependent Fis family transcriptional regulator [Gemmatimonadota bacterium]
MAGDTILVIDDEASQREAVGGYLRKRGFTVLQADNGRRGLEILQGQVVDLVITDLRMPELDGMGVLEAARQTNPDIGVVLVTAFGSVDGAVDAMQEGAFHYLEKPIDLDELDEIVDRALERSHLVSENELLRERIGGGAQFGGIIARDPAMEEALNVVARAAPSRATVLVRGESGTGKELVARAVHDASPRADKPFVGVNCAALNKGLIESELFGHEKGAFTGAIDRRVGRFEQANGGTLFIDELAEIPAEVQVKLLRVLQERKIERVGSGTEIEVDVRLIGATHRDLQGLVADGGFREDLFYRLNVVSVQLPPLRSRKRDIPVLVEHFLARYAEENAKTIEGVSKEAMDLLMRYVYPGNVRELQNIIERAVVMARGDVVTKNDLSLEGQEMQSAAESLPSGTTLSEQVEDLEKKAIAEALQQANGIQSRAADILGLTERNLRYKLKKYGLK